MSYYNKYIKYKSKYLDLKQDFIMVGGKKCLIDNDDNIIFGDGGSTALIIITKNKKAYKMFTTYIWTGDKELKDRIKNSNNRVINEIKIYEALTKNIINRNISHHYVKFLGTNKCKNAKSLFKKCPKTYVEFLKIEKEQRTKLCNNYFQGYPSVKLQDEYKVVEIEYCDYSCADFIKDISKTSIIDMEKYLDIFFFQIIYTIVSTQKIFPYFTQNDLFIRNILGLKEKNNGNYYTYHINNKSYYVPQCIFFPKINDFGLSNISGKYHDRKLYRSVNKDIYNILYDIYNGGNLGSKSLSELCKDDEDKIKFIKEYFRNYFNVDIIDQYITNSKSNMDWDWDNIMDQNFLKSIEMKTPDHLLNNYFYKIFEKINKNISSFKSINKK